MLDLASLDLSGEQVFMCFWCSASWSRIEKFHLWVAECPLKGSDFLKGTKRQLMHAAWKAPSSSGREAGGDELGQQHREAACLL